MAQLSTGAVHVFAQAPNGTGVYPSGNTPLYLGTCEKMPQDQRQPEYEMLMNDVSGTKVPLDLAWEGQSAQLSLTFTRTVQPNIELLLESPRPSTAGAAGAGRNPLGGVTDSPGTWSFADVGSLMSLEGLGWTISLVYTFGAALAAKPAYTGQGLRAGRRYWQCILWAPQRDETGTAPMKQHFMLFSWPYANYKTGDFILYDYDVAVGAIT
jgi:hypothetical protein